MPEITAQAGANEAIWRGWSARWLEAALTWPRDKQIRFTQDERFRHLTNEDKTRIWKAIQANGATPVPRAEKPKPLRTPPPLAAASKSASPHRSWFKGELANALWRALIAWLAILVGVLVALKLFAGG